MHFTAKRNYAAAIVRSAVAADGILPQGQDQIRLTGSGLTMGGRTVVTLAELDGIFASVTLARESATGRSDALGRFDETAVPWDVTKPWVDQRVAELAKELGTVPASKAEKFQVVIAHDVDRTTTWEPTCLANAVLHSTGLRAGAWLPLRDALSSRAISQTIGRLLDFERQQGVGAHYFMMSGPYGLGRYATRTDVRWASARTVGRLVQEAGMSVGLHGSFAAKDLNRYGEEKDRLEQTLGCAVTAHRNHYLRFDPEKLYAQLEAAGIRFDLSVGFVNRTGFRNGCARGHPAFDLSNDRPSRVVSLPQLYMDTVMQHRSPQQILGELRDALIHVRKVQGCVCLVFHPETFLIDKRAWPLFKEILQLCQELGADLAGKLPRAAALAGIKARLASSPENFVRL